MIVYLPNLKQICQGIKEKCAVLFLREDGYFWFIDFLFHIYTRYGSMDKERQLSVWSLHIFFFNSYTGMHY